MRKIVLCLVSIKILCVLLSSCNIDSSQISFDKTAFERERAMWEAQEINNYTFKKKQVAAVQDLFMPV